MSNKKFKMNEKKVRNIIYLTISGKQVNNITVNKFNDKNVQNYKDNPQFKKNALSGNSNFKHDIQIHWNIFRIE